MINWGSVPEWAAALGTLGALTVALWLLGGQLRTYRASEEDRVQRDASRISAWWSLPESIEIGLRKRIATRRAPERRHEVTIHVRISSDNPVYDCIVYLGPTRQPTPGGREDAWDFHFPIVPGGHTLTRSTPSEYLVLEPQDHLPDESGFYRGPWVEIVFTDSTGRHWRRSRRGQLVQRAGPAVDS